VNIFNFLSFIRHFFFSSNLFLFYVLPVSSTPRSVLSVNWEGNEHAHKQMNGSYNCNIPFHLSQIISNQTLWYCRNAWHVIVSEIKMRFMNYGVASGFLWTPTDVHIIYFWEWHTLMIRNYKVLIEVRLGRSKSLVTELSVASCYNGCLTNLIFTSRNM
jgi:hypothetical protein